MSKLYLETNRNTDIQIICKLSSWGWCQKVNISLFQKEQSSQCVVNEGKWATLFEIQAPPEEDLQIIIHRGSVNFKWNLFWATLFKSHTPSVCHFGWFNHRGCWDFMWKSSVSSTIWNSCSPLEKLFLNLPQMHGFQMNGVTQQMP